MTLETKITDENDIIKDRKGITLKFNKLIKSKKLSDKIEKSIYMYSIDKANEYKLKTDWDNAKFRRIYMNKCVSLYSNMDKKSNIKNIEFLKRIKSGEYDVNKIAYMLPTQIFPEHWKTMLDRKASNDNYLYCKQLAPITHKYTCGKCKNKNCSEYEVQIRSSDEPMSTLVECVDCGYRWQF